MTKRIALLALMLSLALPVLAADKLIALTFDDGPRPYVLFGAKPNLYDVLDKNGVKATFFVMGWRLTPHTWGEPRHEQNIGMTCLEAAHRLAQHGYEIEDHTYSHVQLRTAERKKGEQWVIDDVRARRPGGQGRHRRAAQVRAPARLDPARRRAPQARAARLSRADHLLREPDGPARRELAGLSLRRNSPRRGVPSPRWRNR